jgi:hypothetical protein
MARAAPSKYIRAHFAREVARTARVACVAAAATAAKHRHRWCIGAALRCAMLRRYAARLLLLKLRILLLVAALAEVVEEAGDGGNSRRS